MWQKIGSNQYGPSIGGLSKGAILAFNYPQSLGNPPNIIHDPYPLVIIADIFPNTIRGVNLHYLTFPIVKKLLFDLKNCNNQAFSYFSIKGDRYIADAFRTYYRIGIKKPKRLDCSVFESVLTSANAFSEHEIENMRNYIKEQIQRQMQPKPRSGAMNIEETIMRGHDEGLNA